MVCGCLANVFLPCTHVIQYTEIYIESAVGGILQVETIAHDVDSMVRHRYHNTPDVHNNK
jgi:hypothetical protein